MEVIHFTIAPAQRMTKDRQGFEQDGTRLMADIRLLFESPAELHEWIARSNTHPRPGEISKDDKQ